jgi:hypothetical protein
VAILSKEATPTAGEELSSTCRRTHTARSRSSSQVQDLRETLAQRTASKRWTKIVLTKTCLSLRETQCLEDKGSRTEDSRKKKILTRSTIQTSNIEEEDDKLKLIIF